MGWDSSRPVPWQRLMRDWVIYALIMTALLLVFLRGGNVLGALAGVLVSGPLYLAFGAALAKFGYQRKTLAELREERASQRAERGDGAAEPARAAPRSRPAPTKRTSTGPNRPSRRRR